MFSTRLGGFVASIFMSFVVVASADAGPHSEEGAMVLTSEDGALPIPSNMRDVEWIEGHWVGSRFPGHRVEHIITPQEVGHMPGFVRSWEGDNLYFYEITNFEQINGVLNYRVKHFNGDLTGWERAEEVISRPLLGKDDNRLQFDGITFERTSTDSFVVYFRFPNGPREGELLVIPFTRYSTSAVNERDDKEKVSAIYRDIDDNDLSVARQLTNYDRDAVILAPGVPEIRGHVEIAAHLEAIKSSVDIDMVHELVELTALKDVVIAQGRVTGHAGALPDGAKEPFATKNIIIFKRAADKSLKIWRVIYNSAPV